MPTKKYASRYEKENYSNTSPTHLIFKSTIRFVGLTLGPTNLIVNLKLDFMEMSMRWLWKSFFFKKRKKGERENNRKANESKKDL
jgi:hypothetical protein